MFRSTLTVDAVGMVATLEAGTMCTTPCVWQTLVVVAPRARPCAVGLMCLCSSIFESIELLFELLNQVLGDAYRR